MSDFAVLSVISLVGLIGFFLNFYIARLGNEVGDRIAIGIADGNPIPIQHRWIMLYNQWTGYAVGAVAMGAFLAFALGQMAAHVDSGAVKMLAYLGAFLSGVAALSWLLQGFSSFLHYRSLMREAEKG
jgi:hypothetical protein